MRSQRVDLCSHRLARTVDDRSIVLIGCFEIRSERIALRSISWLDDPFHLFYEAARATHSVDTFVSSALQSAAQEHADRNSNDQCAQYCSPCFQFNAHV